MKTNKWLRKTSQGFILLSSLALLMVSLMAFSDPQSVMDLVGVKLTNTDAFSSIRGVYGGVGLTLFISLVYLAWKDVHKGLVFLSLLWGLYALSRLFTSFAEGPLGTFGSTWMFTEGCLCCVALLLLLLSRKEVRI